MCMGGAKYTPPPENRAARRISIKICKKKHTKKNTKIHLYMFIKTFVYMDSIFLFYFKVLHVCFFAVLLFVLFLLVYNCGLSMYSLSRLEQRFFSSLLYVIFSQSGQTLQSQGMKWLTIFSCQL